MTHRVGHKAGNDNDGTPPPKDNDGTPPPKDNNGNGGIDLGGNPNDRITADMQAGLAGFMALANQSAGQLGTVQNQQATAAADAERLKKQFEDESNGNFSI